jgi:hypothetical protein
VKTSRGNFSAASSSAARGAELRVGDLAGQGEQVGRLFGRQQAVGRHCEV